MNYEISEHDTVKPRFQLAIFHEGETHDGIGATCVWQDNKDELIDLVKLLGLELNIEDEPKPPTRLVRACDLPQFKVEDWEGDDPRWDDITFPRKNGEYWRVPDNGVPQVWVVTAPYEGSLRDWDELLEVEF